MKLKCHAPARLTIMAGAAVSCLAYPLTARAQSAPASLQASPIPHILPPAAPELGGAVPSFAAPGSEAALPNVAIPVRQVSILGATAFAPGVLNGAVSGLAGQSVKLAKLEAARRALVALYRSHGYVLSTVTLDIDAQGNVRFVVTEGHIVAVKLSQDIGPAGSMVLAFLNHLTTQRPVSEDALERWLLLAQQIPGVSVHAVLQADAQDPGALTLVAEVSRQSLSALITADDRSFRDTGPAEGLLVLDANSATARGEQTEISLFHTSGGTDNFGQAAESFYLGTEGLRLQLYGAAGRAWPGGALREIGYESVLQSFGGALSDPIILRRDESLVVTGHFDASENEVNTAGLRTSVDNLRVARLGAQYAWQDLWAGGGRDGLSSVIVQLSQGIPALGASPDRRRAGDAGRLGEKIDFWKLNASIGRTQTLFNPTADSNVALRLEAGGQYASDVLPSGEEFDLGGSRFTRGFYSGEVSGDRAAYATAELELNEGYQLNVLKQSFDLGAQFYGFYDWGESWSNLAADAPHRVESAGGGVRLGLTSNLEIDGEAVERLTTRLGPGVKLAETVIYWGVTARY